MTLSIVDRLDLSDLVHRYAACVDTRQFDDLAELFTPTAVLTVPKPPRVLHPCIRHGGRDEIRATVASLGGVIRTHHSVVGEVYTEAATDGTARGFISGVAHHWSEKNGRMHDVVWYLHYADEYHRTESGWRIAQRALSIDAIETRPSRGGVPGK